MTNQTSDEEIEAILINFATWMKRNMGGRQVGGKELTQEKARQAIATLLVKARTNELQHLIPDTVFEMASIDCQRELENTFDNIRNRIAELTLLTPKEKSGEQVNE